jgi:hypothetical protein
VPEESIAFKSAWEYRQNQSLGKRATALSARRLGGGSTNIRALRSSIHFSMCQQRPNPRLFFAAIQI